MVLWGVDPVVRVMWHLQPWQTVILWDRISVSLIAQGEESWTGWGARQHLVVWWSPRQKNVWSGEEVQRPCRGRCVEICEYSSLLSHLYMCIIFSDHGELPAGNSDSYINWEGTSFSIMVHMLIFNLNKTLNLLSTGCNWLQKAF